MKNQKERNHQNWLVLEFGKIMPEHKVINTLIENSRNGKFYNINIQQSDM